MPDTTPKTESRSLSARTSAGFGWVMAWRMVTRVLGVGSTFVLVRLLQPADFGLIAMALSITQAIELLSALGVEDAVVRHPAPTRDTYDTAFTMTVLRAAANAAAVGAAAWPMAAFFDEPRLVPIVLATALGLLITGFENIGIVEFRRDLAYDRALKLRIAPRLAGIATTIGIAAVYHSYWALVAGTLVYRLIGTAMTYTFHPHRPRFTLASWRDLTGFSIWVWFCSMIGMARDRVEVFVIGRIVGSAAVGTFSVAVEIAILPMSELIQPLAQVLFSSFCRAAGDDEESRHLFLRFVGLAAVAGVPAGIGIALLADPMTHLLLGEKWIGAIPVIQIVSAVNALTTFGFLSRAVLEARGRMTDIFAANLIVTVVRIAAGIVLVLSFGVVGGAIGAMIGCCVDQFMLFRNTRQILLLSWPRIGGRLWRPILASVAMSFAVVASGFHATPPGIGATGLISRLLAGALLGAVVYISCLLLTWFAAGRPPGAEIDLLRAARRAISRFRGRFGSSTGMAPK